jgi:hypothetical protein
MRFRKIEFRFSKYNNKYELVSWYEYADGGENCYTIAFFDNNKEGYDMRTIGNRFFEDKDAWVVGKYALEFLNAICKIEQDEEELK